jgi:hypothetical protein
MVGVGGESVQLRVAAYGVSWTWILGSMCLKACDKVLIYAFLDGFEM